MNIFFRLALLSCVSLQLHAAVISPNGAVKDFTTYAQGKKPYEAFDALIASQKPVIVKFQMKGCGPCESTAQSYAQLAEQIGNKAECYVLDVMKCDVGHRYSIRSVPEWIIFANKKVIAQFKRGGLNGEGFENTIKHVLAQRFNITF